MFSILHSVLEPEDEIVLALGEETYSVTQDELRAWLKAIGWDARDKVIDLSTNYPEVLCDLKAQRFALPDRPRKIDDAVPIPPLPEFGQNEDAREYLLPRGVM